MRGTLLNTATVGVGAGLGLLLGKYVPPACESVAIEGLGLVVSLIAVRMFMQSRNVIIVVVAMAAGGVIGVLLGITPLLAGFAEWARVRLGSGGRFDEALITTSVLYCVGPMTILGCIQDGVEGNYELLATKSVLDGISAVFFAATLGAGVLVTAVVVLVVQGSLTLLSKPLRKVLNQQEPIQEATAAGGAMILGIGISLLNLKTLHMETYLPALILAPLLAKIKILSFPKVSPA